MCRAKLNTLHYITRSLIDIILCFIVVLHIIIIIIIIYIGNVII